MKKYFILPLTAVAFLFTFTACLEVEPDVTFPHISDFAIRSVTPAQPNVNVTEGVPAVISAVIIEREGYPITSRVVEWTVESVALPPIAMTTEGNNVYTATIPGLATGTVVYWRVVVTQEGAEAETSPLRTFTFVPPVVAAWNYTEVSANANWPATSGSNTAVTSLAFYYARGNRAELGDAGAGLINVPNDPGGWFLTDGDDRTTPVPAITVDNAAGWVFTLSTTDFQAITFSSEHAASNNGPAQFRLAYRIGTSGAWTAFGDMATIPGATVDGGAVFHPIFSEVPVPATVNNQAEVQIKVWIATNARRSDGTPVNFDGANHSINNIVVGGSPL